MGKDLRRGMDSSAPVKNKKGKKEIKDITYYFECAYCGFDSLKNKFMTCRSCGKKHVKK